MPNAPFWDESLRGNAVNIWYTITVKKMRNPDARKPGGFDRDILEWNIPERDSF